jgi:hypothetical protein
VVESFEILRAASSRTIGLMPFYVTFRASKRHVECLLLAVFGRAAIFGGWQLDAMKPTFERGS